MPLLGKKFPAPIAAPMWPFYTAGTKSDSRQRRQKEEDHSEQRREVEKSARQELTGHCAGLVIAYGINSLQGAMMQSDEFKNDPRNPNSNAPAKPH